MSRRIATLAIFGAVLITASFQVAAVTVASVPGYYLSSSGTGGTATLQPRPSVSVDVSAAFAYEDLYYYFEVLGTPGTTANVHVSGSLSASEHYAGTFVPAFQGVLPQYDELASVAVVDLSAGGASLLEATIGSTGARGTQTGYIGTPNTVQLFSGDLAVSSSTLFFSGLLALQTDTLYEVIMQANLGGYYNTPGQLVSGGSVTADPIFTIDPSMADSGYQIVLSEGIGNRAAAPVPEPASGMMLGLGIPLLGWLARRRRQSNTAG